MRIQKFLSNYGFCSRRQAEEYIKEGKVVLNGDTVRELGTKINVESDTIFVDGVEVKRKKTPPIYIALNKPKGYISSCKHKGEKTVIDLINIKERVYPVGRLDKDSTGLIILTNDGTLHHKLSHPSFNHEKEYEVVVNKNIQDSDLKKMAKGIVLDGKKTRPAKVNRIDDCSFIIVLKEGRNRQIRRMAEALNFKVVSLKRVRIESIKLDRLQSGKFRLLSDREVKKIIKKDKEMKNKIKLGKITYINAAPVYYGIDSDKIFTQELKDFEIIAKPPASLNSMIKKKEIDISPISSVAYAKLCDDLILLPNFSISSFGEVLSVLLISKYELSELNDKKVFITNESETAKSLLKLICFENDISPRFEVKKNSELLSQDADAVLLIGDIALKNEWDNKKYKYTYDLGEVWYNKTKLPFVFAVWAVRKEFAQNSKDKVLKAFNILNKSRQIGLSDIETIISKASYKIGISEQLCRKYYKLLNCFLTQKHIESLELFFGELYSAGIIEKKAEISFLKF